MRVSPNPVPALATSAPTSVETFITTPITALPTVAYDSKCTTLVSHATFEVFSRYPYTRSVAVASASTFADTSAHTDALTIVPATTPREEHPYSSFTTEKCLVYFSVSLVMVGPFGLGSSSAVNGFSLHSFTEVFLTSSDMVPSLTMVDPSRIVRSLVFLLGSISGFESQLMVVPADFLPSIVNAPRVQGFTVGSSTSLDMYSKSG